MRILELCPTGVFFWAVSPDGCLKVFLVAAVASFSSFLARNLDWMYIELYIKIGNLKPLGGGGQWITCSQNAFSWVCGHSHWLMKTPAGFWESVKWWEVYCPIKMDGIMVVSVVEGSVLTASNMGVSGGTNPLEVPWAVQNLSQHTEEEASPKRTDPGKKFGSSKQVLYIYILFSKIIWLDL